MGACTMTGSDCTAEGLKKKKGARALVSVCCTGLHVNTKQAGGCQTSRAEKKTKRHEWGTRAFSGVPQHLVLLHAYSKPVCAYDPILASFRKIGNPVIQGANLMKVVDIIRSGEAHRGSSFPKGVRTRTRIFETLCHPCPTQPRRAESEVCARRRRRVVVLSLS